MALEAITNAEDFLQTWDNKEPPYELPNGEVVTTKRKTRFCFTLRGQEHSIDVSHIDKITTLVRKPTQEVFAGYDLFFIFEKIGLYKWQFRTIDIDGTEEIHTQGRYTKVKIEAQEYINQYDELPPQSSKSVAESV